MATHKRRKRTRPIEVRVLAKPETTPDGIIAGALLEVSDIYGDRAGTVVLPEVMAFIEKLEGFGEGREWILESYDGRRVRCRFRTKAEKDAGAPVILGKAD